MFLFILIVFSFLLTGISARNCEPIRIHGNIEVYCNNDRKVWTLFNGNGNTCSSSQSPGTIAKYKCRPFYTPLHKISDGRQIENELICDNTGDWIGLDKYYSFRCKEDCGGISTNAKPLVLNGVPVSRGNWPWHASMYRQVKETWKYLCGGSIIRNQIILTSAHCVATDHNNVVDAKNFRVVVGAVSSNYYENLGSNGTQIHTVQAIFVSENFDPKNAFQADIAILSLKGIIEFNDYVIPICLPENFHDDVNALRPGVVSQVAGYGKTETNEFSKTLRVVSLVIRSNAQCYAALTRVLSESQFCAGSQEGGNWMTLCNGDSGGGLGVSSAAHQKYFLHGIVSWGDNKNGRCDNYAAFTRVYPFVFWIRDIIEEIGGQNARALIQAQQYPFILRGTSVHRVIFSRLPREWENRVTSIEISYATIEPYSLINTLEYARTLVSLNLSHVGIHNVTNFNLAKRIVLPNLLNFYLDIDQSDRVINDSMLLPFDFTNESLASIIFFEKEYKQEKYWKLDTILNLKTNIDAISSIFKLIHINHQLGELSFSRFPFVNEILNSLPYTDFVLKQIALSSCVLNSTLLQSVTTLHTIVLDEVDINNMKFISNQTNLNVFVLNYKNGTNVNLDIMTLPNKVNHVCLGNGVNLVYRNLEGYQGVSRITFPAATKANTAMNNRKLKYLGHLETFCCIHCKISSPLQNKFTQIFPNLKSVILDIDGINNINITKLQQSKKLEVIIVEINENILRSNKVKSAIFYGKFKDTWIKHNISTEKLHTYKYRCSRKGMFWTSEEDYILKTRLRRYEAEAYRTKNLVYNGERDPFGGLGLMHPIPARLQPLLKSWTARTTELTPQIVLTSIEHAKNLERMTYSNLSFVGGLAPDIYQSQEVQFVLNTVRLKGSKFVYVNDYFNNHLVSITIPFQNVGRFLNTSTNPFYNLMSNLSCIHFNMDTEIDPVILFPYDATVGESVEAVDYILDIIKNLDSDPPLKMKSKYLEKLIATFRNGGDIFPVETRLNGLNKITQTILENMFEQTAIKFRGQKELIRRYLKHHLVALKHRFFLTQVLRDDPIPRILRVGLSLPGKIFPGRTTHFHHNHK